ncbi:hypothetical protein GCM10009533_68850 [Saccharopolyspora spinosporotrichia]|uniref:Uncharacterized protein n=1 Tax=Saccharopolyspora erythraea TaxID=1836 RepID=A0ABP3PFK8_SACER
MQATITDLHNAGCDILTITQYLRPSARHHAVERWVKPEEFAEHARFATETASQGCWWARWCAPPTAPDGSTRTPWPPRPHDDCRKPDGSARTPR